MTKNNNNNVIFNIIFVIAGWLGLFLILMFTINSGFTGTRLGLCWIMLEER